MYFICHKCVQSALTPQRMCVETRVFYPTISQRSCHVQHSTCSHNAGRHSILNIQEFQNAFSTLHCTVSKRIWHGKSGYSVHTVCSYIAQNVRWITGVLANDIAAILPCKALYVQPKCSHTLHVQYTRVSSCFFIIKFYSKQVYFTWEKCIQCAYDVFLQCTECSFNHGCFIRRHRSDPAMYSTLRATM